MGLHFEEKILRSIVAVAFNSTGKLFAFGMRDENLRNKKVSGAVGLRAWDGQEIKLLIHFKLGGFESAVGEPELDRVPLHLAFNNTDHWLAVQTDKTLELRDMSLSKNAEVNLPDSSVGAIVFNPSSSLLAVGHSQGMKVLHVPDLSVALDKKDAAVTAIAFSPDGCLLAWADIDGVVHLTSSPSR